MVMPPHASSSGSDVATECATSMSHSCFVGVGHNVEWQVVGVRNVVVSPEIGSCGGRLPGVVVVVVFLQLPLGFS